MKIFWILILPFALFSSCKDAESFYKQGEMAQTIGEREMAFNKALALYNEIEKPSGKLYFNLGNCYYQLGEYGMAIWYYQKAKELLPRDRKIENNLIKAEKKANLPISEMESIVKSIFFFHYKLTLFEKRLILSMLIIATTILGSLALWFKSRLINNLLFITIFLTSFPSISLLWDTFIEKDQVVMIHPSFLYSDAGMEYSSIGDELVLSGEKLWVIDTVDTWYKVKDRKGRIGFVSSQVARIVQ